MRKHLGLIVLAVLVVVLLGVYTVSFQVDQLRDIVLVKTFGKVTRVYRGAVGEDAGLHFKWPWPIEQVVRYDARTFLFEDPYKQTELRDKTHVLVSMYCAWRVAEPVKFYQAVGTEEVATDKLRGLLVSNKSAVFGQYTLGNLINTDPARMRLHEIEQAILAAVAQTAAADYGVEVREVGVKLIGVPKSVSQEIIEAQKESQQTEINNYLVAGKAQATAIRERARAASQQILAFAKRKAEDIKTQGERDAAAYYRAFSENEALSMFLRNLESLRNNLKENTVMVLDGSEWPALKWLRQGPSLPTPGAPGGAQTPDSEAPGR